MEKKIDGQKSIFQRGKSMCEVMRQTGGNAGGWPGATPQEKALEEIRLLR